MDAIALLRELLLGPGPIAWVQQAIGPGWAPFFRVVTTPGTSWGVIAAVGLALWFRGRETAYPLIGIVVLQALASTLMNLVFFLPRPDAPSIIRYEELEIGSFPSGHVFTATVVWGWLHVARLLPLWVSGSIVAIVGLSRIYLGVHFVGDVLGGLAIGCAVVWLHARLWPRIEGWLAGRGRGFYVGVGVASVVAAVAAVTRVEADNPYAWSATGVMVAAPFALALERSLPDRRAAGGRAAILGVVIGLAGVLPFLALWLRLPTEATLPAAVATGAATLWAWAAAPGIQRGRTDR